MTDCNEKDVFEGFTLTNSYLSPAYVYWEVDIEPNSLL